MTDLRLGIQSAAQGTCVTLTNVSGGKVLHEATGPKPPPRPPRDPSPEQLGELGQALAEVLFPGDIGPVLAAQLQRGPTRLWLDVDTPELKSWPWEFALLEGRPLYSLNKTYLVRGKGSGPVVTLGPDKRRVLVVCADPKTSDYPSLGAASDELQSILHALSRPECRQFEVRDLRRATLSGLQREIEDFRPHIFHFVGHGDIDATGGYLVLEAEGGSRKLYGETLAQWLTKCGAKLAVLSGCLTGGLAGSVGECLIEAGLPAVVGMQWPILDTKTRPFVRALYASLAEDLPVERAVQDGREAIHGPECGIPVLMANPVQCEVAQERTFSDGQPFIGRKGEIEELVNRVTLDKKRLVTITGMGGMGKTSLARQVATRALSKLPGGVWMIECDGVEGRDGLISAISTPILAEGASIDGICARLGTRRSLLVLDCFEKIVEHASVLDEILARSPGVSMLVTSRKLLGLARETEFELLPLPAGKRESDRLALFVEAASFVGVDPVRDPESRKLAIELVDLLEGVPLALILAARRLRYMALPELLSRLRTRKNKILSDPTRSDRHASIEIVIRDSFELLSDPEKNLAMQLSVFEGGFTLADAVAVLFGIADVEDLIFRLRDQSLLICREADGAMRYRCYDTVQEFMEDEARSLDLTEIRRRHYLYFTQKGEEVRRLFADGDLDGSGKRLRTDLANFRAATRNAARAEDLEMLLRLAASLARPFLEMGQRSEFLRMAEAVEMADAGIELQIEIKGLLGTLARRDRKFADAEKFWLERADLCGREGRYDDRADSLLDCTDMNQRIGNPGRAQELLDLYMASEATVTKNALKASARVMAADLALLRDDVEGVLGFLSEAEAFSASSPDKENLYVWIGLGRINRRAGRAEESLRWLKRMAWVSLRSTYHHYVGTALIDFSLTYEDLARPDRAAHALALAQKTPGSRTTSLPGRLKTRIAEHVAAFGADGVEREKKRLKKAKWEPSVIEFLEMDD